MRASFQDRVKEHLSRYRTVTLGIEEQGVWTGNGRSYPHILPAQLAKRNILPSIYERFWKSPQSQAKLHKNFHHLNSSQALCFNLFFPYLESEARLRLLTYVLAINEHPGTGAHFEYSPRPEEGTSIDFVLPLASGSRVLFEIKYTEQDFGKAKDDEEHRRKFEQIYLPELQGRFTEDFCSRAAFFKHYQLLRNIWHLRPETSDVVVFLIPRANKSLERGLKTLELCVAEAFRASVRVVFLEDFVDALTASSPTILQIRLQNSEKNIWKCLMHRA